MGAAGGPAEADAELIEQPSTWGKAWVQQLLGLGTLQADDATETAYRRFHASVWLPRLRCVLLALGLLSFVELASELSTEGTPDASFHAQLRSRYPAEGRVGFALTALVRCCMVGVTIASTFTRWAPLQGQLARRYPPSTLS